MAIRRDRDDKTYKYPNRYSEHLKKVFQDETGGYTFATYFIPGSSMFAAAVIALPLSVSNYEGPAADPDLYTGILNQTQNYSFLSTEISAYGNRVETFYRGVDDGYLLIHNAEGYALYEVNEQDSNRIMLVDNPELALEKIQEGLSFMNERSSILKDQAVNLSPFEELNTPFATCDALSGPFNYQGGVERFQDDRHSCDQIQATPTDAMLEYQQNASFWENAITHVEAGEHYGIDEDALIPAELDNHFVNYLQNAGLLALGFGGLWIGGLSAGAGVSRRKAIKAKKAKSSPKP